MRFDAPEHLQAWKDRGEFPAIHNGIFGLFTAMNQGESVLDLGCSYGLLGQRILQSDRSLKVVGMDADLAVLQAAKQAGIKIDLIHLHVSSDTMVGLDAVIASRNVDTLICRRILPELWGEDIEGGREFAKVLRRLKVQQIFIEGRVNTPNAVNPLRTITEEVSLLTGPFKEVRRYGALSLMEVVG